MDGSAFDRLTKTLTEPRSRRGVSHILGGVAIGEALGLLGVAESTARKKKPCPPCKTRKKGKCKGKLPDGSPCSGGTCRSGDCVAAVPPPTTSPRKPNASCNVASSGNIFVYKSAAADLRYAQTFTEPNGGQLTAAGVVLYNVNDQAGEYLLQLNTVDSSGTPTSNTIASATRPSSQVGRNADVVWFSFATPATVVAGRQYALVLSVNAGGVQGGTECHAPVACPGGQLFFYDSTLFRFQIYGGCGGGAPNEFAFYEAYVVA